EQNKYSEDFLEFNEVGLAEIVAIARSMTRASDIDLTILLRNWGQLSKPYKALYGAVSASDLVAWHTKYKEKLFIENVRFVIEKSDVNESIIETAMKEPGHFWYYNNGITAICDSFEKQPMG